MLFVWVFSVFSNSVCGVHYVLLYLYVSTKYAFFTDEVRIIFCDNILEISSIVKLSLPVFYVFSVYFLYFCVVFAWFSAHPIGIIEFMTVILFHFQVPVKDKEPPPQVKEPLVKPTAPSEGTQLLF